MFDARTVAKAATGTADELARQGMLTRAVRVERAPRGGWFWAWTWDELGSSNTARSLRRLRARDLRRERAARREVAGAMAADRLGLERGRFYAITPKGKTALVEAGA